MKFLKRLLLGRFRTLGLLSDVAMVAAAASRVARRPGGTTASSAAGAGPGELVLVAGAAFRLLRRIRRVRKNRRAAGVIDVTADD